MPSTRTNPVGPNPLDPHRTAQQERLRSAERQKRLSADTEKLLALATDLKAQVDKAGDTLPVDAIKEANEIEKLAHSVGSQLKQ
jgi:hypothetical protein